jgi:DNA-binding phage protein
MLVAATLGDVARAKGMAEIARETGLGRESLYKALSPQGNPEFATALKVLQAITGKILANPLEIGYLTTSNALQWRLPYGRVIEKVG